MSERGRTCLWCKKKLRAMPSYRRRGDSRVRYGGFGDNRFCGQKCGWRWANNCLDEYDKHWRAVEPVLARTRREGE